MGSLIEIGPTSLVVLIVLTSYLTSWTIASPVEKRSACKDSSPNCEKWATEGMCRQDPDMEAFMGRRCPFACDVCGARGKRKVKRLITECEDVAPNCEEMALEDLCHDPAHQAFMEKACPYACDVCSDRKRRKVRAIADMRRSIIDAKEGKKEEKRGCMDLSDKCEHYAVDGLCSDSETSVLMAKTCPYACDECKRELSSRSSCEDTDPACEEMATDGLCFDPEHQQFMEKACSFACDVCSGRKKRRARAIAELHLDAAAIDAAAANLIEADKRACEDFSPKCEMFASDGLCTDSETSVLMAKTCPHACDGCKREVEVKEEDEEEKKEEKEMSTKAADLAAREVSRKEVRAAMKEEREKEGRTFASLISDAASADGAAAAAVDAAEDVERRGCRDFSPKCANYAVSGLCRHHETSSLMAKTCPSSCGQCTKREIESYVPAEVKRAICKDVKVRCEAWALHGMCKSDPDMEHFMAKTCPFACDLC